jgi:response regulator RpfG family c-di-GMP phosphodiesterase
MLSLTSKAMLMPKKQSRGIMEEITSVNLSLSNNLFLTVAVEEEQQDLKRRMNAGIVANVVTGLMSVELVEVVPEEEADQETVEVDLRETGTKEEEAQVEDAAEVDLEKEDPES